MADPAFVLVAMVAREVLPVLWADAVAIPEVLLAIVARLPASSAAPDGSGVEERDTGMVPLTLTVGLPELSRARVLPLETILVLCVPSVRCPVLVTRVARLPVS